MDKPILIKDLGMLYPKETSKEKRRFGIYKCICGNKFNAQIGNVKRGLVKSCGCSKNKDKVIHGQRKHRLYSAWFNMLQRCYNKENPTYKYYGNIGIKVCDKWLILDGFIEDMDNTYIKGLSLDRIDNGGNYEPSNCRWTTKTIQSRNTRKIYSHNKSGYRGVCWAKNNNKWLASIRVNGKSIFLGYFKTAIDGAKAYDYYVLENNLEHTINNVGI